MALLKIRTLQAIEGAQAFCYTDDTMQTILIAISDLNWSAELDKKESAEDVEEELIMYLFNLMDEAEAEHLAHELTLIIFDKGDNI
ncbi:MULTISPECIES: YueH family protein [Staphylococcus]|uniref:YueH family protein n=1 Tax=Staphylococcus TaxID=1279 RepID=UPI0021CFEAA3|nr:YueH family protein [Staphylococcus sp. IVB6181]UXV34372.1 YueH family protein [Staphylococcus sp. IVB6181]